MGISMKFRDLVFFFGLVFALPFSLVAGDEASYQGRNVSHYNEKIITGGQPTQADLEKMANNGVTTIVNFRGAGEFDGYNQAELVQSLGMQYVEIPIESADALNKESVDLMNQALAGAEGQAFLHCGSSNRVGALIALDAFWNKGLSQEEAMQEGKKAGLSSLESRVGKTMADYTE